MQQRGEHVVGPLPLDQRLRRQHQAMAQDGRVRVNVDPSDLDVTPPISEELEEVDGEVVAEAEQGDWPEPATPGGEA